MEVEKRDDKFLSDKVEYEQCVIITSNDGNIIVYANGKYKQWRATSNSTYSNIALVKDKIIYGSSNGEIKIYSLEGILLKEWKIFLNICSILTIKNKIFILSNTGEITVWSLDGNFIIKWKFRENGFWANKFLQIGDNILIHTADTLKLYSQEGILLKEWKCYILSNVSDIFCVGDDLYGLWDYMEIDILSLDNKEIRKSKIAIKNTRDVDFIFPVQTDKICVVYDDVISIYSQCELLYKWQTNARIRIAVSYEDKIFTNSSDIINVWSLQGEIIDNIVLHMSILPTKIISIRKDFDKLPMLHLFKYYIDLPTDIVSMIEQYI